MVTGDENSPPHRPAPSQEIAELEVGNDLQGPQYATLIFASGEPETTGKLQNFIYPGLTVLN